MKHTKTDPACIHYAETGPFRRYLNERGRGKACLVCVPPFESDPSPHINRIREVVSQLLGMAENREALLKNERIGDDEWTRADVEAKSYRTAVALISKATLPTHNDKDTA